MTNLIQANGKLTSLGLLALQALAADIEGVLAGHLDNTKETCRVDLSGHDACYTCNRVEAALRAAVAA